MNDAQSSGANGGLRVVSLSPDELDKLASVFVPAWESPTDPGIAPPPADVFRAAPQQNFVGKKTMMGIAAPLASSPMLDPTLPDATVPSTAAPPIVFQAAPAQPVITYGKAAPPTPLLADSSTGIGAIPRKRSPLLFVIGGGLVVAAIAVYFVSRNGDSESPKKETPTTVTEKKLDLPDPNLVTPTAATKTTAAAPTDEKSGETATAKTAEPTPEAKTAETDSPKSAPATTKAAANPPATAAPKTTATVKPATTAKPVSKKPQKIKDEF